MSILSKQNILGNPALVGATRPGKDTLASIYAFATDYVAEDAIKAITPWFVDPKSYSYDAEMEDVTKVDPSDPPEGIDGSTILYDGTQYGTAGFAKLGDNQQTNLGAAAQVLAGNTEAVHTTLPPDNSALESTNEKTTVTPGPGAISSGGATEAYSPQQTYSVNKATTDSTSTQPGGFVPSPTQMPDGPDLDSAVAAESNGGGGGEVSAPAVIQGDPMLARFAHQNTEAATTKIDNPGGDYYSTGNGANQMPDYGYDM